MDLGDATPLAGTLKLALKAAISTWHVRFIAPVTVVLEPQSRGRYLAVMPSERQMRHC